MPEKITYKKMSYSMSSSDLDNLKRAKKGDERIMSKKNGKIDEEHVHKLMIASSDLKKVDKKRKRK